MHFRLHYILRDLHFGDVEIRVSDPLKQIDVLIKKGSPGDKRATREPGHWVATATCQREIPPRHHSAAISSGTLSVKRETVSQVQEDASNLILHTVRLARWRTASPGGPNPVLSADEFSWSVDGTEWKPVADNFSIKLVFGMPSRIWTSEAAEFVQKEALGDLDEPLGHELLREALENSEKNLRSALVLAAVAAEVGFKQFASKSFPDADWILEHLPSPPLVKMLQVFPWPKLRIRIDGKVPSIPAEMEQELKKAIKLRNEIVHVGNVTLKRETVDSALKVVRDLLYFLDALRRQKWALENVSPEAIRAISGRQSGTTG